MFFQTASCTDLKFWEGKSIWQFVAQDLAAYFKTRIEESQIKAEESKWK